MFAKLSEYIDNELDDVSCEDVKRHLAQCEPCQACLETLKRTVTICHEVDDEPVPENFSERLKTAISALVGQAAADAQHR